MPVLPTEEAVKIGSAVVGHDIPLAKRAQIWNAVASHYSEHANKMINGQCESISHQMN